MDAQQLLLASAMTAVALTGCTKATTNAFDPSARTDRIAVTITNDHWLDMAVYAVRGTTRFRVGTVPSLTTTTIRLPQGVAPDGTVRLMADPIGEQSRFVTDPILVSRGQRIALRIATRISMSSYAVWNR